ncbi:MAG TPA: hypothetical protein VK843_06665 [Planctomycetota bacterium]|nr:hypothetical protein [Planctomycetota bacterium]
MSNDPEPHAGDFAHLEPLPDLPLEPLPELPPEAQSSAPAAASAGGSTRAAQASLGQSPAALAARAQEKAPQLLKKASRILVVGSMLPWTGLALGGNGMAVNAGLKVLLLAGCAVMLKGVHAHYLGAAAKGFGTAPIVAGKKGMIGALNGLHLVATAVIVASLILELVLLDNKVVVGESLSLLLGGLTFVHIDSYEKGGKFSPLFPLMFLGCALGGLAALVARIQNISSDFTTWLAALGCALVTAAGVLAVYTIAVAMMQAKKDGDLKKAAAVEARKQARGATRSGPGSREPTI